MSEFGNVLSGLIEKYKNALLYEQAEETRHLEEKLSSILSAEELENVQASSASWVAQCRRVAEHAREAVHRGVRRASLAFESLKQEARELKGNAIGYMCAAFDRELADVSPETTVTVVPNQVRKTGLSKRQILHELRVYASWDDAHGAPKVKELMEELRQAYPHAIAEGEAQIKQGHRVREYFGKANRLGSRPSSEEAWEKLRQEMRLAGLNKFEQEKAQQKYERAATAHQRFLDARRLEREIRAQDETRASMPPDSQAKDKVDRLTVTHQRAQDARQMERGNSVQHVTMASLLPRSQADWDDLCDYDVLLGRIHPNCITDLPASKKWTFLFDETGRDFSAEANSRSPKDSALGRGVMLLVPESVTLPDLPAKWHATDAGLSSVLKVIGTLLHSSCGIIGIPCSVLPVIHGERWFACIETLLDVILRLLPIDGQTEIELLVEQRGEASPHNSFLLRKTCEDVLFHLARIHPERAENLHLRGRIIAKDQHPWNGYVDAAAFAWTSHSISMALEQTHWRDTCLLESSPKILSHCLDLLAQEQEVPAEEWGKLLEDPSTQSSHSLWGALLQTLGAEAKRNLALWQRYLDHVVTHLNSKAINMPLLKRQLVWLTEWQPAEGELSPKARLLWLTAQLAEENHRGDVTSFQQYREEFVELSERLFEEDAPLTCHAALNLAVSYTDEFAFEEAQKVLAPWQDRRPEVPGLQYYGRLLSSFGQHEAFLGHPEAAVKRFDEAIQVFQRLSDQGIAAGEIAHTSAYLLTSLMDILPDKAHIFSLASRQYFGGTIAEAAKTLGCSVDDGKKYHHHVLLRYLVSGHASEEEKEAYLSVKNQWKTGTDHPWELIEFYRGMLVSEASEREAHFRKGYEEAIAGDGPLLVIGAVILGTLLLEHSEEEEAYLALVKRCRLELPALGERGDILAEQPTARRSALELASLVLPFNFR